MGELIKIIQTDNSTKLQMERNNTSQINISKDHKCQKRVTFVFIYFFHQFIVSKLSLQKEYIYTFQR